MRKAAENFGLALTILLMTAAIFTFLGPRFGWRVDAVCSGSMEPKLKVGGVVITRPVAAEDIAIGDIITFHCPLNEKLTSHRVISIGQNSSSQFRTKGDANEDADPFAVPAENVVGKVCFHIPYLGYAAQFVQTPLGLLLTLGLPGLVIIVMEMRSIWRAVAEEQTERRYRIKRADERQKVAYSAGKLGSSPPG